MPSLYPFHPYLCRQGATQICICQIWSTRKFLFLQGVLQRDSLKDCLKAICCPSSCKETGVSWGNQAKIWIRSSELGHYQCRWTEMLHNLPPLVLLTENTVFQGHAFIVENAEQNIFSAALNEQSKFHCYYCRLFLACPTEIPAFIQISVFFLLPLPMAFFFVPVNF